MKLVREHINEKFATESDPIKDMGIGIVGLWDYTLEEAADEIWATMKPNVYHQVLHARQSGRTYAIFPVIITKDGCEKLAFEPNEYTMKELVKAVQKRIDHAIKIGLINLTNVKYYPIKECINEKFTDESDPLKDMNIGEINRIRKSLKELGIPETDIEIDDNFEIYYKRGFSKPYGLIQLQLKQLSPEKREFVQAISRLQNKQYGPTTDPQAEFEKYVKEAVKKGINSKDIHKLVNEFGDDHQIKILTVPLTKYTRTKKETKEDEENNLYVFIGYTEKTPVTINGEKYYKDKLQAEKLVKIDRYNPSDLQMVSMMKLRAQVQYEHKQEGAVYMIYVPKDFMDEESYNAIPDEYRYIIEKYKRKI